VNLGARTLLSPAALDFLAEQPLPRVVLELTEHAAVDDYGLPAGALAPPLRAEGLRVPAPACGTCCGWAPT
jgi:hypothetical protein